jgi:hypothetical protein
MKGIPTRCRSEPKAQQTLIILGGGEFNSFDDNSGGDAQSIGVEINMRMDKNAFPGFIFGIKIISV